MTLPEICRVLLDDGRHISDGDVRGLLRTIAKYERTLKCMVIWAQLDGRCSHCHELGKEAEEALKK